MDFKMSKNFLGFEAKISNATYALIEPFVHKVEKFDDFLAHQHRHPHCLN
jgi:hypothetical protein